MRIQISFAKIIPKARYCALRVMKWPGLYSAALIVDAHRETKVTKSKISSHSDNKSRHINGRSGGNVLLHRIAATAVG